MTYKIAIKNQKFEVEIGEIRGGTAAVTVNGTPYEVVIENYYEIKAGPASEPAAAYQKTVPKTPSQQGKPAAKSAAKTGPSLSAAGDGLIAAQIPGRILAVNIGVGDEVKKDQTLAIMEAMKMENNILATRDGIVREVNIQKGSEVSTGDVMIVIG
jgi:biotin carboxyl carrier protein